MDKVEFKTGDYVRYIPDHAHGDANHRHCENGIVTSVNEKYVFVRYFYKHGGLKTNSKATNPENLILIQRPKTKEVQHG